jgi:haloacetate dehalogenase
MQFFPGFETIDVDVEGCTIHAVKGGNGPPLLLLHGYPQTHVCWHKIAPVLASSFTVVAADLRGYGDSTKPEGGDNHSAYSKRQMAADMASLMTKLGFDQFSAAGHDRGGRVTQRLAQDFPDRVKKIAVLDIIPMTLEPDMFKKVDARFGHDTYHWFFLSQPSDLPERLIGSDPGFFLRWTLESWAATAGWMKEEVFQEYLRTFSRPETIHATCEDYRAGVTADTAGPAPGRIGCPVLSIWGRSSKFGPRFDPIAYWKTQADIVEGIEVPGGHFIAEESPKEVAAALHRFFGRSANPDAVSA